MRSPWQRTAAWSPQDVAEELHRRRADLIGQLRRRSDSSGVPLAAQEEIVDDAITAVVISRSTVSALARIAISMRAQASTTNNRILYLDSRATAV